jgi:hypothetical protein
MTIICTCIGCGCDDLHACDDDSVGDGCHWLIEDRHIGLGVCSMCPDEVKRWHKGERMPSRKALIGEAIAIIQDERDTLFSCAVDPRTNRVPDREDREEIRKFDRWLGFAKESIK